MERLFVLRSVGLPDDYPPTVTRDPVEALERAASDPCGVKVQVLHLVEASTA